jgi:hypothetical protein
LGGFGSKGRVFLSGGGTITGFVVSGRTFTGGGTTFGSQAPATFGGCRGTEVDSNLGGGTTTAEVDSNLGGGTTTGVVRLQGQFAFSSTHSTSGPGTTGGDADADTGTGGGGGGGGGGGRCFAGGGAEDDEELPPSRSRFIDGVTLMCFPPHSSIRTLSMTNASSASR